MSLSVDLSLCDPLIQERVPLLIMAYAEEQVPWRIRVTRAKATTDEQQALWLQGRSSLIAVNQARQIAGLWPITDEENKHKVTNCDGVTKVSEHQKGRAVDVVAYKDPDETGPIKSVVSWSDVQYVPLGGLAKRFGLVWGGWWQQADRPHLELPKEG